MTQVTLKTLEKEIQDFRKEYTDGMVTMGGIMTEFKAMQKTVETHDKILVTGNGNPSLQEDVRNIKEFIKSVKFWMTALAMAFIGQFVAIGVTVVVVVIQALPYLKAVAEK